MLPPAHAAAHLLGLGLAVLGDNPNARVRPEDLLRGVPEHPGELPVDAHDAPRVVVEEDRLRRALDQLVEQHLLALALRLGPAPIGDVEHEADHARRAAVGISYQATLELEPVDAAVAIDDPILGRHVASHPRALDCRFHRRPVLRVDEPQPGVVRAVVGARR